MGGIRQWLESSLSLGPYIQDLLIFPVLAAIFALALWYAILAGILLRVRDQERRAKLRARLPYVAVVPGVALLIGVWLSFLRLVVNLFGDRSPEEIEQIRALFNGGLYAVLSTAALILLLRFLRKPVALVSKRMDVWAGAGDPFSFRGLELVSRDRIRDSVLFVTRATRTLLVLLLLYIYFPLVFSFFPATAPLSGQLLQYITEPVGEVVRAIIGYIPNLIYVAVIVFAVRYTLKLVRFLLNAVGRGDLAFGSFEPDWADPTYKLIRSLGVIFALMIAYPYLPGSESEFFRGFSLFVGALVTLGSTSVIGNLVSGVILTYTRAFRIGDRVRIGDAVGDVLVKSLFVTRMRTILNEEITVPNSVVLGGQVVNFTTAAKRGKLVLTTEVGIGYDVHWSKMEKLLTTAASRTPGILDDPRPFIWLKTLGDFAVVYELHAYTDRADRMGGIYSELRRNTLDVLHDAGVEIMTPNVQAVRDASGAAVPTENAGGGAGPASGIRVRISGEDVAPNRRLGDS